jgi:hypothetical protein
MDNIGKGLATIGIAAVCIAALHYGHPGAAIVIGIFGFMGVWND